MRPVRTLLWLVACCAIAAPAGAQPVYEDRVEEYVVVAGDTISGITQRTLGDATFWRDNWKLNPGVADPDRLTIGQRLRIIAERRIVAEAARVLEAVNKTEKMLERPRWQPASQGDELASGQGLRTRERSTAVLNFNAESRLELGEFSQVFLARKETTLRGVDRGSVQVEQGTVDLVFAPIVRPRTEIEVITGPASAIPEQAPSRGLQMRTATTADGGAKVMVYEGRSSVAAAGATVAVTSGMGTSVPERGPPQPPEALLPAPRPVHARIEWNHGNGVLEWLPVAGAARYALSLCGDETCLDLLQTALVDGSRTRFQVQPLTAGRAYWRIRALSASGLDGYPSPSAQVDVIDGRLDSDGPMIALQPVGGDDASTAPSFLIHAFDEHSGLDRIELRRPGADWHAWDGAAIDRSAMSGLQFRALDRIGNVSHEIHLRESTAAAGTAD